MWQKSPFSLARIHARWEGVGNLLWSSCCALSHQRSRVHARKRRRLVSYVAEHAPRCSLLSNMRNSTHNRFLNIFVLMLRTKQASHSPYHPFLLTVRILETPKLSLEDSITYLLIGLLKGFSITVNQKNRIHQTWNNNQYKTSPMEWSRTKRRHTKSKSTIVESEAVARI